MFLATLIALLVCVNGRDLVEPKFQVLTPDELMIEVPHYEDATLVTFRIGVQREGHAEEDLELGENDINNDRIFIYDQRLDLNKGDTVNYLLAFKGGEGYRAQTGKYVFDGVYYKKPFGRRHRFRRHLSSSTTEKSEYNTEEDTEEFNPAEPRFGFHPHHRNGGRWPHHGHHPHGNGFNPFGPGGGPRPFSPFPPNGPPPPYGPHNGRYDCNDHRHDMCHGRDSERSQSTTNEPNGGYGNSEYHCKMCNNYGSQNRESTTVRTSSTTSDDSPEIDIRFAD